MKRIALVQVAMLIFVGLAQVASGQLASSSAVNGHHKVQVTNRALGQKMAAAGARLIADYGGYLLYDAPDAAAHLPADQAELRDDYNVILLSANRLDTTTAPAKALRKAVGDFSGKRLHLVQFAGPVQPAWRQSLLDAGARIINYIPQNTYLIYSDSPGLARVQALAAAAPHVQWDGAFLDDYKIHPSARPGAAQTDQFAIQLVSDDDVNGDTLRLIDQLKLAPITRQRHVLDYVDVVVRVAPADLARIAARPDVISIQTYGTPRKLCERQDQIVAGNLSGGIPSGPGYLAWLQSKGFTQAQFTASGIVVDVSDSGIDDGTTSPNHFGFYVGGNITNGVSRVVYNRLEGTPNPGSTLAGCDGHGNINAHIVGGFDNRSNSTSELVFEDALGYHYGLGVCPFVLLGSSVIFDPTNWTEPTYEDLISQAYADGARISNNSWGDGTNAVYNLDSQEFDSLVRDAQPAGSAFAAPGNQEMVLVFAAGNDGFNYDGPGPYDGTSNPGSVSPPGTGKNIICVGASDSVQEFGGANDGSDLGGVVDSQATNANDMVNFSSLGPCADGRQKPDLVAPGTHISGGAPQAADPGPTGSALLCFLDNTTNTVGVDGGPDNSFFYPVNGQQFYTASSGTSHSTPCVCGGCALLRQYFINQGWTPPSPAMTKAWLMNAARYLNGSGANDNLWSPSQGMGEMNLGTSFDGTPRLLRDEDAGDMFTASGQTRVFAGVVANTKQPFRVTVAWTDTPGNTFGAAYNNDLDLTVTVGGHTYKGNVFSGAYSATGGSADTRNNVESVFLPAGVSGNYTVTIAATSVNSVGVPGGAGLVNQDFALVVYNAGQAPDLASGGATLIQESCLPTNGVIDPGETVSVEFAIQNAGFASTTNLVATLLAGNGVTSPSGPQSFGALEPGATGTNVFSFTAEGSCGGTLTATLQLQDGAANLGTVSYNFLLGQLVITTNWSENFNEVTLPYQPEGWSASDTADYAMWTTTNGVTDGGPNAAFCPDSPVVDKAFLVSPSITLPKGPSQLRFLQSFNLEDTFDGGVLQISINGSSVFNDIVKAGGSFATGGYIEQIVAETPASYEDPLTNQNAWSGNSDGFFNTVVDLPVAAEGKPIKLRWVCGTDFENASPVTGWWIAAIAITQTNWSCCSAPVVVVPAFQSPANGTVSTSGSITITGTALAGASLTLEDNGRSNETVTVNGLGVFDATASLTAGTNVLVLTQAGTSTSSAALTVLFSPPLPTLSVASVSATNVAVGGHGLAGAIINLLTNGVLAANFTNNAAGAFSGTVILPDGVYSMSTTEIVTGQTLGPSAATSVTVLTVSAPTLNVAAVSLPSVAVSGQGLAGAIVKLLTNGVLAANFTNNNSGAFAGSVTLPNGVYSVSATESEDGLTSSPSAPVTVTVMTLPAPTLTVATKSAPSVAVSGRGQAGAVINLLVNGAVEAKFTNNASGIYAGAIVLSNGIYSLSATETTNGLTSLPSAATTVTVLTVPAPIILFPTNGFATNSATFTMTGTGVSGAKVSAYKGTNVVGTATVSSADKFSLTVKLTNNGAQELTASQTSNGISSAASAPVTVTMNLIPVITAQPQNLTSIPKETVTFSAAAYGAAPLSYVWQKNGTKISGAATNLTLANLAATSAGDYRMIAANSYGSATSAVGVLTMVPNPFLNLTGTYYGLFTNSPVQFETSGFLTLTLGSLGSFSGSILGGGLSSNFSGAFSLAGAAQVAVKPWLVNMNLDLSNGTDQILGTVSNATGIASLQADLATFATTNPCPVASNYTMIFTNSDSATAGPDGAGFGVVSITKAGLLSWNGFLADSTNVVASAVSVSKSGQWPLYIPLYGKLGSLSGWIDFSNDGTFAGEANWFRLPTGGKLFTNGFTNVLAVTGSTFTPGTTKVPVLQPTNLDLTLSGGGLIAPTNVSLILSNTGKFGTNSLNGLKLSLVATNSTGRIGGTFLDPQTGSSTLIKGVVLQRQSNAAGFFLTTNASGLFELNP